MKASRSILAAALALAATFALAAGPAEGESRLAQLLEGRTAGEPVSCVPSFNTNRLEVIDDVALVYNAGDTLYVARPTNPEALDRGDIVVINRFGGRLCHSDIIRTVDRFGGYTTGVLFLDKFVPYRKAD